MQKSTGGSEWRTIMLYEALKPHAKVNLWGENLPWRRHDIDPHWRQAYPVQRLVAFPGYFPVGGTQVFVGAWSLPGSWVRWSRPRRTILIHNTNEPERLRRCLRRLSRGGRRDVELFYASAGLAKRSGLPGPVHLSPIDLDRFKPAEKRRTTGEFVVGRLSRDVPEKHHPDDIELYRRLAESGCRIRIMGGMSLADSLSGVVGIDLIEEGRIPAEEFLRQLDCFLYRTDDSWVETFGRVVFEAMACGLPVVCGRGGDYRDYIEDGRNGFLFESVDQAFEIVMRLKEDDRLRRETGRLARENTERLYSRESIQKTLNDYLR